MNYPEKFKLDNDLLEDKTKFSIFQAEILIIYLFKYFNNLFNEKAYIDINNNFFFNFNEIINTCKNMTKYTNHSQQQLDIKHLE